MRDLTLSRIMLVLIAVCLALEATHAQAPPSTEESAAAQPPHSIVKQMREALGGGADSIAMYRNNLGHDDADVRAAAAELLLMEAGSTGIDDVLPLLEDRSDTVILAVARSLLQLDDPRVRPAIRRILSTGTTSLRTDTVIYISEYKDGRFVEDVGGLLSHPDLGLRRVASNALRGIGSPDCLKHCLSATSDSDQRVVANAVSCLQVLKNPVALQRIAILSDSKEVLVRSAVARAIPALGGTSSYGKQLEKLLGDPSPSVRYAVLTGLGDNPTGDAVRILEKHVNNDDPVFRQQLAQALAPNRTPKALQALVDMLDDDDESVRIAVVSAFDSRKASESLESLAPLVSDQSAAVRLSLALVLGSLDGSGAYPLLVKMSEDDDDMVRAEAVYQAAVIGGASSIGLLKKALGDGPAIVRSEVIRALGEIEDPKAFSLLRSVAVDAKHVLQDRVAAITSLGRMKDKDSIDTLKDLKKDPAEQVRAAARTALSNLGVR